MTRILFASVAAVTLSAGLSAAADVKSGPQAGEKVPGPFHPLNVNGEDAGKKACLYCKNGPNPVAVVFARTPEDPQTQKLIKALDAATQKHAKADMGSYAVFLTSDAAAEKKLKEITDKAGLKALVVAIESPEGPSKYNINKDADVTVLLYTEFVVKANHAFDKGKITDKDIERVAADVTKILPTK